MRYYLSNDHQYVKGKTAGAVYDLKSERIFRVNQDACRVLDSIIENTVDDLPEGSLVFIKKLIELGIVTEKQPVSEKTVQSTPRLIYAWLELTEKCNMDCIHCYGDFGHPTTKENKDYLTVGEWKRILLRLSTEGLKNVQFIGGEPLLYPHVAELLKYAYELGISVDIFTNGYFIDDTLINVLKKTGTKLRISLYGHNSNIHDSITHYKGSFSKIDKTLDLLKLNGVQASIAVVIMKENEQYFHDIKRYVENKGFYFSYDVIRPVSCGHQSSHFITDVSILSDRFYTKPAFSVSRESFFQNKQWNSCWFGKLAITSTGDILPCTFARNLACGNLRRDAWKDIREKLLTYWKMTKDHVDSCSSCEYRYACHDCRPLAMGTTGGIHDKYPRCCYDPLNGIWEELQLK